MNLKGVGPYTASAIASFAFKIPRAVLDGNVFRVLSRFFGIKDPIDSSKGKVIFEKLATELLDKTDPGRYNQSIMDFGAVICKPKQPRCEECPLREKCFAYKNDIVHLLPVKEKKIKQKERWFAFLIISEGGEIYIRQRPKGDIWENLHEFVMIECYSEDELLNIKKDVRFTSLFGKGGYKVTGQTSLYRQKLTHQTINSIFISVDAKTVLLPPGYLKVNEKAMNRLAFPKVITTFLADKNVSLNLTKGV